MTWKKLFIVLVIFPAIPFALGVLGMITISFYPGNYSTFSSNFPTILSNSSNESVHVRAFIHGKDSDPMQLMGLLSFDQEPNNNLQQVYQFFPDWSKWARNFLRVSKNSFEIGHKYGEQLSKLPRITSVHLVAHSAGAFFAYGACKALRKYNKDVEVQTTYLAPLSIKNLFQRDFGINNFGTCADFSDAYFDEFDTVPGANRPLPYTFSFNLTKIREACSLIPCPPHTAPVSLYSQALADNRVPLLKDRDTDLNKFPQGGETDILPGAKIWR